MKSPEEVYQELVVKIAKAIKEAQEELKRLQGNGK